MDDKRQLNRRDFLAIVTGAIGGVIGIALVIPGVAYIIGPALQGKKTENWIRLGATSKVELGTPTLFKTTVESQTGWLINEKEISIYILTENGRDYSALSNICTHLGCRVRWITEREQFFCPCHNAIFDKDGTVVSGPPPRPLDQFEVKVENEMLYVLVEG